VLDSCPSEEERKEEKVVMIRRRMMKVGMEMEIWIMIMEWIYEDAIV
jgi:hypothetical protein